MLGLHFALEGAREGDTTVFATFDENPSQIAAAAASFGWSFDVPEIHLVYRSAVDLHLDEWVYGLLELVESATSAVSSSTAWPTYALQLTIQRGFRNTCTRWCSGSPGTQ